MKPVKALAMAQGAQKAAKSSALSKAMGMTPKTNVGLGFAANFKKRAEGKTYSSPAGSVRVFNEVLTRKRT